MSNSIYWGLRNEHLQCKSQADATRAQDKEHQRQAAAEVDHQLSALRSGLDALDKRSEDQILKEIEARKQAIQVNCQFFRQHCLLWRVFLSY